MILEVKLDITQQKCLQTAISEITSKIMNAVLTTVSN